MYGLPISGVFVNIFKLYQPLWIKGDYSMRLWISLGLKMAALT
jgi:hypothetical protein